MAKRQRKQQIFWLDSSNPRHMEAWQAIGGLKQQRKFNPSVINGLRLINDLNQGKTDVLLELYPLIAQAFQSQESPSGGGGNSDKLLQEMLTLLKQQPITGYVPEGENSMVLKQLEGATRDESEPVIELKKDSSGGKAGWNFLIAGAALSGDYSQLAAPILDYGIASGKIPARFGTPKPVDRAAIEAVTNGDGNSKIMQVPQFAAPVFDDD